MHNDKFTVKAVNDAVEWAMTHAMMLKDSPFSASHAAFVTTPTQISAQRYQTLIDTAPLLGKMVDAVSEDALFIQQAIKPLISGDTFFSALLTMHQKIHFSESPVRRVPMLIMRSDFMDDAVLGPKLIEFNAIAAGMGPFGQRAHELHHYLQNQWPTTFTPWQGEGAATLIENKAIEQLGEGIAKATFQIKQEFNDSTPATFLMVVQANEDNVFDQHLLELELQRRGIRTIRRTFSELYGNLSTGDNHRLLLEGIGSIDTVYLRAGYQFSDYCSDNIVEEVCCEALMNTRMFMEQHRIAMNATVGQQLASSKRVQMLLSSMPVSELSSFGLTITEAEQVKSVLGEMLPVTDQSVSWFATQSEQDWVLKNQGEGGGHCIFGQDIAPKLSVLRTEDFHAWSLMRRLQPQPRTTPALAVRKGQTEIIDDLISEIGIFTVHLAGKPITQNKGYAGYLIRSKSTRTTEGGIHSGQGVLDSLALSEL